MRPVPFVRRVSRVAGVTVLLLAGPACRDSRRMPSEEWSPQAGPVRIDGVTLDESSTPRQVVEALVGLLRRSCEIRRAGLGDAERAAEFDAVQLNLYRLAAAQAIYDVALRDPYRLMPKSLRPARAVQIVASEWPAAVAYYVDGIDLSSLVEQAVSEQEARVSIRAESPRDRAVLAEIRASLVGQRDVRGEPLEPGSPRFEELLRRRAVERGVSPNPQSEIQITLRREAGGWRVARVTVGPATAVVAATPAATPPGAASQAR